MVLAAASVSLNCGNGGQPDSDLDKNFLRDAKVMEAMGLPVYWLGREFTAGGLTFQGPYGGEFGGEVEGGGIDMDYVSWLDGTPFEGTNIGLKITVYGPNAWGLASGRIMTPPPPGVPSQYSVTRRTVDVMGREAELISVPSGDRPANRLRLILELDPVVVVGEAASVLSSDAEGASELNILIKNPDLLVQVIGENLRPYPE